MLANVNGVDIHYEVSGDGPWVVLSHSLAADASIWERQAEALAQHYTVLRYDTRGHGRSGVPPGPYAFAALVQDVLGLLDHLQVARAHFAGISMGGMIGQHLALAAPGRVASLVLADTTSRYGPEAVGLWEERIRQVRAQGMQPQVEPTLGRWFTAPFRQAHPDVMARIGAQIAATDPEGFCACGMAIATMDTSERLKEIACPTLVICGEQDAGTTPAMAREIAAGIPGARLEILREAAHLSNIEQAEAFNRVLLAFLAARS